MRALMVAAVFAIPLTALWPATPSAAWAALDKALQTGSTEHRQQAIVALSTLAGDAQAAKRAENLLQDESIRVRQSAALALGKIGDKDAIPYLRKALDDTSEVAFAAAKALEDLGDTSGRGVLIAVLAGERKDGPSMTTKAVREAKQKMHHPEGLLLMGIGDAAGTIFWPAGMGISAAQDTMSLQSKGSPGRAAAAAYLVKDPDPYAVSLLEWALSDDSHFVRIEAARGLGERGNAQSIAKLDPLLGDSHPAVRAMAAAAIIRISGRIAGSANTADRAH
jgi:HEAT repeat protein